MVSFLEASVLALTMTKDLTRKNKSFENERKLTFGCKSLPNTSNLSLGLDYEKEKVLVGTREWVMTRMGQCLEIPQVRQQASLRKRSSPGWLTGESLSGAAHPALCPSA